MLKKLIKKLYLKYCEPDLVSMTRLQMLGTTQSVDVLDLPNTERKEISDEAKMLLESEVLKLAFSNVKNRCMNHIQTQAETTDIILHDRFSINGACLVEDELNAFADFVPGDSNEFDPQDVI